MTQTSPIEILRVPPTAVNLADEFEFQQIEVRGVQLAVDLEARKRIAAASEVSKLGDAAVTAIPLLITMLDQDRVSAAATGVVAAFSPGNATRDDARQAENMARLAEADLACHVAAADALAEIGTPAIANLIEALAASSPNRRSGAAKVLGSIGPAAEAAVPQLVALARADQAETVRNAAADAIKKIEPETA
jgi:HEAT repeat protein